MPAPGGARGQTAGGFGGGPLNIEVRGEGPDLLLVHGFGTSRKVWEPLLPHLGGFRLWLLDLPGHGESPWSPGALTMEALIEALSSLPLREAWGMGWSMGGLILAAFAQRFPGRISRLFMVASTPRFLQGPDWPWGLDPDVFHGFRRELREHPGKVLRRFAALQVQGAEGGREAFKGLLDALSWACPGALEEGMALLEDTDLR
ncbi:MAG: alpha/beta fold hydrolase, partial [Gammaproteobacteria bacterium]